VNYRKNEDRLCVADKPAYNAVISVVRIPQGVEPITVDEAKIHMRITYEDYDNYINILIKNCRRALEDDKLISIGENEITAELNNGLGNIQLPYGPVRTIGSMIDFEGTEITDYEETLDFRIKTPVADYIKVVYTAGMAEIPESIIQEMLELVDFVYRKEGTMAEGIKKISRAESKRLWLL